MTRPQSLRKGDTIFIVSTARAITAEELKPAIAILKTWGLSYVLGHTIGARENQFAGSDRSRSIDFQEAINNPEVKAIWCARGGYGTARMVDALDFSVFLKNPKWIIGYSDITVLHNHINNLGVATIHGQMCLEIEAKTEATRITLKEAIFGNLNEIQYKVKTSSLNKNGTTKGILVGGNLSVLYSIIGSSSMVDLKGKILFIEDLDEMLYHIDRMLQSLKRSRILESLAGIIVGGMSVMRDNTIPFGKSANEIVAEAVSSYNFPVCYGFPAGHVEDNRALIFGTEIELEITNENCTVSYL
jgi:muramoyltetrapeptide carboxypeptidase